MKRIICVLSVIVLLAGCAPGVKSGEFSRTEVLMGTFVELKVVAPEYSQRKVKNIVNDVLKEADRLQKKFSIFDPASEINALNITGMGKVSPGLFDLVQKAKRIGLVTDGEFDITVAPVLKATGFYEDMPSQILKRIPDRFEGVGWKNIVLEQNTRRIILRKGAWLDLSGIAKGYIVDEMAELLKKKGITHFLINAGGDIYCTSKDKGDVWKIGVREPAKEKIVITLGVKNVAVATSGDYENVVIDKDTGQTLSHIIEPSVKKAVGELPSSITVIAPACYQADALATGMMAMGPDKAMALANTMKRVEIITVEYTKDHLSKVNYSQAAAEYVLRR